jgi:hypothetical protein
MSTSHPKRHEIMHNSKKGFLKLSINVSVKEDLCFENLSHKDKLQCTGRGYNKIKNQKLRNKEIIKNGCDKLQPLKALTILNLEKGEGIYIVF